MVVGVLGARVMVGLLETRDVGVLEACVVVGVLGARVALGF